MHEVPTLRMLARSMADIQRQANRIVRSIRRGVTGAAAETIAGFSQPVGAGLRPAPPNAEVTTIDGFSQMGSGSLPGQDLPTRLVAVRSKSIGAEALAKGLRLHSTPVFARVQHDQVLIDPRTLLDGEEKIVVQAIVGLLAQAPRRS